MAEGKRGQSKKIKATERRSLALELRIAGNSYREIAKQTGVSVSTVWDDINDALLALADKEQEKTTLLRQLDLERLDALLVANWTEATHGNTQASNVIVRILDRRAKLLGLDKPQQLDITQNISTGPNWNAQQLAILEALKAFPDARAAVASALMALNPIEGEVVVEGGQDA